MRKEIIKLRKEGKKYDEICEILKCSKSTVSYHIGTRRSKERLYYLREFKNCPNCGEKIPNGTEAKFCDLNCYKEYNIKKRRKNLEDGLIIDNFTIRKALIDKYGNICSECNQNSVWNNKSLVLQVDHIDGNSDNNSEVNLRLLCPNCHSQTITFCGGCSPKNTKRNNYLRKYKAL